MPEQLVQKVEEAWGLQFAPGHNDSLSFMAHLWEPVRCHFRPLVGISSPTCGGGGDHVDPGSMGEV